MGRETYERLRNAGVGKLVRVNGIWIMVIAASDCEDCVLQEDDNRCDVHLCLGRYRSDESHVKFLPVDMAGIEIKEVENV